MCYQVLGIVQEYLLYIGDWLFIVLGQVVDYQVCCIGFDFEQCGSGVVGVLCIDVVLGVCLGYVLQQLVVWCGGGEIYFQYFGYVDWVDQVVF